MKKHTFWIVLVGFAFLMATTAPVLAQGKVDINKAKAKSKKMMANPCAAKAKKAMNPCKAKAKAKKVMANPCAAKAKAKKAMNPCKKSLKGIGESKAK